MANELKGTKATPSQKTVLKMIFASEDNKNVTWNLESPKDGLTWNEVSTWMDKAIDDELIVSSLGGRATDIKDAYIYTTSVEELAE